MEFSEYLRFAFALVFVLSLIGGLALLAKRLGWTDGRFGPARSGARLEVVETLTLDARRRAVILRRDDVEHLILLGAGPEVVVEAGFSSGRPAASQPAPDNGATPGTFTAKVISGLFSANPVTGKSE